MAEEPKINTCKYWITDEPVVCSHWNADNTMCTFEGIDVNGRPFKASHYPYCNLIGTSIKCNNYDGTGTKARCVLPDPFRHVCNRETGEKWVTVTGTAIYSADGGMTKAAEWDWDKITEYNNGDCDEKGTSFECAGYSPYIMGFGKLKPEPLPIDLLAELAKPWTSYKTIEELGYRLPLSYVVWNKMSELSRCYWWDDDPEEFTIDEDMGFIDSINHRCTCPDEITNEYENHKFDSYGRYIPPCNGMCNECPRYTGICWQYCTIDKMQEGDKILSEQIIELRYYLRKEQWEIEKYEKAFINYHIFAWVGPEGMHYVYNNDGNLDVEKTIIDTIETYQDSFDVLQINYKKTPVSEGTPAQDGKIKYPTLVKELKDLYLYPIIRNEFDKDDQGNNLFEVTNLQNEEILIVGDMFWYNSITYAVNLSDPELEKIVPSELFAFDNMRDILSGYEKNFKEGNVASEKWTEFYDKLDCLLNNLMTYYPDKIVESEIGSKYNMFYMGVSSYFGENEIFVFNKGSGSWEYDRIKIIKSLCGGVIRQTSFSIIGDGEPIDRLPWYESNFMTNHNENGMVEFKFFPFVSEYVNQGEDHVAYVYNDFVENVIPSTPITTDNHYRVLYKYYKTTVYENKIISMENMKFIGNAGYVLVVVPDDDKLIHNVHQPWEVDGDIYLTIASLNEGEASKEIKMVVHEQGTSRLEVNQIILKPNNIEDFSAPCLGSFIILDKICVYEKRSFGETPTGIGYSEEPVISGAINDAGWDSMDISGSNNSYTITKFSIDPLFVSVVYKGANGRIKGITRTKMLMWVRQPFCRDVEIYYGWQAAYQKMKLLPDTFCWGKHGFEISENNVYHHRTPKCGDHEQSSFSGKGPMWYPYNACDPYERYKIITQFTEWDISIIEQFDGNHGDHGAFDLRMLGPDASYGYTCDNHAHWVNCTCDWSFCNDSKTGVNVFTGYGRYRGLLSYEDRQKCLRNSGTLPNFGNVPRDFLRSFRSTDSVHYYKVDDTGQYRRLRKWVPPYEFYTKSDITGNVDDYPFELYTLDYDSPFVDQFGLLKASTIEEINISETVDNEHRYRFEDIFQPRYTWSSLRYPYLKQRTISQFGAELTVWLTYKDYPEDPNKSIHWVWQDIWTEIERHSIDISEIPCEDEESFEDSYLSYPYSFVENTIKGKHLFLDIEYPEYKYSYDLTEHRLTCDEDNHTILFTPPSFKIKDDGTIDKFFWLMLDAGHYRAFDVDGNWDPDGHKDTNPGGSGPNAYPELYEICVNSPWLEDVTLFANGYTDKTTTKAETDNRVIEFYDDVGIKQKEYYQRGLDIQILSDKFINMPIQHDLLSADYNIVFSSKPDYFYISSGLENLEAGESFAWTQNCFNVGYDCIGSNISIRFEIPKSSDDVSEESGIGAISRIECSFTIGAEEIVEDIPDNLPENVWFGELSHIPAVTVKVNGAEKYTSSMELSTKDTSIKTERKIYDLNITINDIFTVKEFEAEQRKIKKEGLGDPDTSVEVELVFRVTPTQSEINDVEGLSDYYVFCNNVVKIDCIYIYHANIVEAVEEIKIYERKYKVSYGDHGDIPPAGRNNTGSLLYPPNGETSTVYQQDTVYGMIGMSNSNGELTSMNKCRGRIMKSCMEDKTPLDPGTIYEWEKEQKKIHDEIVNSGSTSFIMNAVFPPDFEEELNNIGMNINGYHCSFTNTYVCYLAEMLQKDPYSPCGHEFYHDYDGMNLLVWDMCGGLVFGHFTRNDVFEYSYKNTCMGGGAGTIDVFTAWIKQGLIAFIADPLVFEKSDDIRRSTTDYSTQTTEDTTGFVLPDTIDPLN